MNDGRRVRAMEPDDVDEVAAIEARAFSSPWPAEMFHTLLEQKGAVLLVLELDALPVAGYAILWCVLEQGELSNIAVAEEWRGRALGSYLLDAVLDRAARQGVEQLFLEVRESNTVAQELYRTRGFVLIGRRADYYRHPREDARVLVKTLAPGGDDLPKEPER